jgi:uncharacterized membrane protein
MKKLALCSALSERNPMTYNAPLSGSRPKRVSLPGQVTLGTFAAAFFTFALVCDWAYVQTAVLMWRDFASWLLFAGLVCGGIAVILWLLGLAIYRQRHSWVEVLLSAAVLVLALVNSLVHAGDGWTAIMPYGLGLSLVTVVLLAVTGTLRRFATNPMYPD